MARVLKASKENLDYVQNGVAISPSLPTVGDKVQIVYDGLLSKSGATHVYAHIGYGSRWENEQDVPMVKTNVGFETTVPVMRSDTFNLCFKDCANHWDNNSGMNYTFDVAQ